MSKYNELCKKGEKNRDQFTTYEKDCAHFIENFRLTLVKYLDCSEDRIVWQKFSPDVYCTDQDKTIISLNFFQNMILFEDAFYGFCFRILLGNPKSTLSGLYYVDVFISMKKDDSKFTIKLGEETKHLDLNELPLLIENLVTKLELELDNEFQNFLNNDKKHSVGFKIGQTP